MHFPVSDLKSKVMGNQVITYVLNTISDPFFDNKVV